MVRLQGHADQELVLWDGSANRKALRLKDEEGGRNALDLSSPASLLFSVPHCPCLLAVAATHASREKVTHFLFTLKLNKDEKIVNSLK